MLKLRVPKRNEKQKDRIFMEWFEHEYAQWYQGEYDIGDEKDGQGIIIAREEVKFENYEQGKMHGECITYC